MYICTDLTRQLFIWKDFEGERDGKAFNTVPHCTNIFTTWAIAAFSWFSAAFFPTSAKLPWFLVFFFFKIPYFHLIFSPLCVWFVLRIVFFSCCRSFQTWFFVFSFLPKALVQNWNPDEILNAVYALDLRNRTDRIQGGRIMRKYRGTAQRFIYTECLTRRTKVGFSYGCWDVWGYVLLRYKA